MNETIFVAGLGYTGSSAVIDLMKEVDSYFVFEDEFRLLVDPDGIINLRDALTKNWSIFQSEMAIRRYIKLVNNINTRFRSPYSTLGHSKYFDNKLIEMTKKYIKNLTEVTFRGFWYGIDNLLIRQLNKYNFLYKKKIVTKELKIGKNLTEEEFDKITNKYLHSLIEYLLQKHKKTHICFNENYSCMFPARILNLIKNSKLLLVIRDPRDVFSSGINANAVFAPNDVEDFIKLESAIYSRWISIWRDLKNDKYLQERIKIIRFEELVLAYDNIRTEIFDFCNIEFKDHIYPQKYFKPSVSIKNVGLWKNTISPEIAHRFVSQFEKFYKVYNYEI